MTMSKLEKTARAIAGIYNASAPFGMGVLHHTPEKMKPYEALAHAMVAAVAGKVYFDYHRGRLMKISITSEGEPWDGRIHAHDRDYFEGHAERSIAEGMVDPHYDCLAFPESGKARPDVSIAVAVKLDAPGDHEPFWIGPSHRIFECDPRTQALVKVIDSLADDAEHAYTVADVYDPDPQAHIRTGAPSRLNEGLIFFVEYEPIGAFVRCQIVDLLHSHVF